MNTIQIVTNSDRCHVSVNNRPVATFLYSNYSHKTDEANKEHALHDAKAQTFITLSQCRSEGMKVDINTDIVAK